MRGKGQTTFDKLFVLLEQSEVMFNQQISEKQMNRFQQIKVVKAESGTQTLDLLFVQPWRKAQVMVHANLLIREYLGSLF